LKIQFDRPPAAGADSQGLAVRYAAARRQVPRWRWYLLLAIVVGPILFFAGRLALALLWDTVPAVVVLPQLTLRAGAAGVVDQVPAEGATVTEGLQLLTLARPSPAAPSPAAPAARGAEGAALLNAVDQRAAGQRIDAAQAALALGQQVQQWRQQRLAAVEALRSQGAATTAERDAAHAALVAAQADLIRARADLAGAQMSLARARAEQTAAGLAAPALPVQATLPAPEAVGPRAPFDGTVTQVLVKRREWVAADTEVLVVQGRAAPVVRAFVAPDRGEHAQRGARATLVFPDRSTIEGTVTEIDTAIGRLPSERTGLLSPRSQTLVVTLKLDGEVPARWRIHNLPVDARFPRF